MNLGNLTFQVNLPDQLYQFIVIYTEKFVFDPLLPLAIPPKNNTNNKKSFHKISEDALLNYLHTKNHIQNPHFVKYVLLWLYSAGKETCLAWKTWWKTDASKIVNFKLSI